MFLPICLTYQRDSAEYNIGGGPWTGTLTDCKTKGAAAEVCALFCLYIADQSIVTGAHYYYCPYIGTTSWTMLRNTELEYPKLNVSSSTLESILFPMARGITSSFPAPMQKL